MKALIIDDEENVREAIKLLCDWRSLGIDSILEADNGKTGTEMLEREKPDIVLLDMCMPSMNGVEFLRSAENLNHHAVNIIISGYGDYEFTRQAIRSRTFDYLLKPIDRGQINATLKKAVEQVKQEQRVQNELNQMNMSLETLKEKIFLSAIAGNFNYKLYETQLDMMGIDARENCFGAAVLRVMNIENICQMEFKGDRNILTVGFLNIIGEICGNYFKHFCFKNSKNESEFVVIVTDGGKNDMGKLAAEALMRVKRKLSELFDAVAVIGAGDFNVGIKRLSESFEAAEEQLGSINLFRLDELPSNRAQGLAVDSILSSMPVIKRTLESGSAEASRGIVDAYLDKIEQAGSLSLSDAKTVLTEYVVMMNDIMSQHKVDECMRLDSGSSFIRSGISFEYTDFPQFRRLLRDIMKYCLSKINKNQREQGRFDIEKVKEDIDRNFYRKINISMFTDEYFLSKVYIMKLFKRKYGMSLYEYVQKVRMNKARELLKNSGINIQDISNMVGYSNNNYFSKAFKNFYHISPTEYRLMLLEKEKDTSGVETGLRIAP